MKLAETEFPPLNQALQRFAQWFGRYPAFYGFNYNDEVFFDNVPFNSLHRQRTRRGSQQKARSSSGTRRRMCTALA